jgi:hypothetical protein
MGDRVPRRVEERLFDPLLFLPALFFRAEPAEPLLFDAPERELLFLRAEVPRDEPAEALLRDDPREPPPLVPRLLAADRDEPRRAEERDDFLVLAMSLSRVSR